MPNKNSDARLRANNKWNIENYDTYAVRLDKALSAEFMELIEQMQLSKNAALKQAVIEFIENHKSIN